MGAVLSYVNMAIGSLIPMFYTPVMLELLGQSEYGLFKLSSSITSYLSLISFGIGSAVVRYLTKYRAEEDRDGEEGVFALFNVIFAVIAVVTILTGVIITFSLDFVYGNSISEAGQMWELRVLVLILSATTSLNFLCTPYNAVVTSHERFIFLQVINILTTVVTPIINIIVLYFGYKSIGMVVSSFLLSIVIQICYIFYVHNSIGIKPNYKKMPKFLIKEILVFSFWIFVSNVVSQLYNSTDTLIIGAVPALSTIGVAIYSIGATFGTMMVNFSVGITSVLTPKINTMVFTNKTNTELTDLMIRIGRLQCYIIGLVCFGFIAFGRQFIYLWAGTGYEDAYWVAIVTMIPGCIPLIQGVALSIIVAKNKHKFRSLVFLCIAIINVVGTIICIKYFGIIGAAAVTGGALLLGQGLVMNWYYWKVIGLEIPRFWKNVLHLYIIPIILACLTLVLSKFIDFYNWGSFFAGVIVFTVVFIVLNWTLKMNHYEKDIFVGPVKRIMKKFTKKN